MVYSFIVFNNNNFEEALCQVVRIGYRFVEFAGFFDHTVKEVTAMLKRFGLANLRHGFGLEGSCPGFHWGPLPIIMQSEIRILSYRKPFSGHMTSWTILFTYNQ